MVSHSKETYLSYIEELKSNLRGIRKTGPLTTPFMLVDLNSLGRKVSHWKSLLPIIEPFYAIKCNPDPRIVSEMAELGVGFDCASRSEIELVLSNSVPADKIIFANPHKEDLDILYALTNDVFLMTFDSLEELKKIKSVIKNSGNRVQREEFKTEIKLVLRVKVENEKAATNLNEKFGLELSEADKILKFLCKENLDLYGVSFHVGSLCYDKNAYKRALLNAEKVFLKMAEFGMPLPGLLDIGGGFCGGTHGGFHCEDVNDQFKETADLILDVLDSTFYPRFPDLKVISEPGRFFVESCQTFVVKVIRRRKMFKDNKIASIKYIINHGALGVFKDSVLIGHKFHPILLDPLTENKTNKNEVGFDLEYESSFYGFSESDENCIIRSIKYPLLETGTDLFFVSMGAYTSSISSEKIDVFYRRIGERENINKI